MRRLRNILAFRPASGPAGALESFAAGFARTQGAHLHLLDMPVPEGDHGRGPLAVNGGPREPTHSAALAKLLRDYAGTIRIDLVVLQRIPGRGDRTADSPAAPGIVRDAGVPVLTLPAAGPSTTEAVRTVLVPADLSDPGDPALEAGRRLAAGLDADLLLLDVTGLGTWLGGLEGLRGLEALPVPADEVTELGDARTLSERALIRLRQRLAGRPGGGGDRRRPRPAAGDAGEGVDLLLSFVAQVDGCLAVVSRDGLQSLRRPFGPSVADVMADRAPCPVLIVESGRAAAPVSLPIRKSA